LLKKNCTSCEVSENYFSTCIKLLKIIEVIENNNVVDTIFLWVLAIKGDQRSQVIAAKSKIDAIIKRGRLKQTMTHFVSLPMVNEMVIHNYLLFKVNSIINLRDELFLLIITIYLICNRIRFLKNVANVVGFLNFCSKISYVSI
jgi:hypothetical protein